MAITDGAVTGRRESAVGWAGMPVPHALTMIQSFSDEDTKELFESETNRRFATISRVALRKLIQMNQPVSYGILPSCPATGLKLSRVAFRAFIRFVSTTNGALSSGGLMPDQNKWQS